MTIKEMKEKYRIELRSRSKPGWGSDAWCVIFDKEANDYIKDENTPRNAMKRFKDVNTALAFIESIKMTLDEDDK